MSPMETNNQIYFNKVPYDYLVIKQTGKEEPLFAIRNDGTIEGTIMNSGEAGKIFIESMRIHGQTLLERIHSLEEGMRKISQGAEDPRLIASQYLNGVVK